MHHCPGPGPTRSLPFPSRFSPLREGPSVPEWRACIDGKVTSFPSQSGEVRAWLNCVRMFWYVKGA